MTYYIMYTVVLDVSRYPKHIIITINSFVKRGQTITAL